MARSGCATWPVRMRSRAPARSAATPSRDANPTRGSASRWRTWRACLLVDELRADLRDEVRAAGRGVVLVAAANAAEDRDRVVFGGVDRVGVGDVHQVVTETVRVAVGLEQHP